MSTATRAQRSSSFGWGSSSLSRTLAHRSPFAGSSGLAIPADLQAQAATAIGGGAAASEAEKEQARETLFGPVIGDEGDEEDGLGEHGVGEKGREREKVSVDVVKGWVEKAKANTTEPHPTTTLQSLVNLKRPTLHLSPLASTPSRHTLKFTYDLSSAQALLTLHLYLPAPTPANPQALTEEVVYQAVIPGGFGKTWALPEEVALDLEQAQAQVDDAVKRVGEWAERATEAKDEGKNAAAEIEVPALGSSAQAEHRRAGGLGRLFGRGRQEADVEQQQGEVPLTPLNVAKGGPEDEHKAKGVRKDIRLVVRLEARGERGEALGELNAQRTHVDISYHPALTASAAAADSTLAVNPPAAVAPALETAADGTVALEGTAGAGEGPRKKDSWTAKVVRREALIGNHTFQLKEIFGLTSSAAQSDPAPASYPPAPTAAEDLYNSSNTPNECIVCLVAPRDVVLLPCRHLVVCKECAVGMVEFGAGGKVLRREEGGGELGAGNAAEGAESAEGQAAAAAGAQEGSGEVRVDAAQQARQEARRRRKAKGWFCPVCRQPYTSLLRIALPSTKPGLQRTITAVSSHSHHDDPSSPLSAAYPSAFGADGKAQWGEEVRRAPSPVPTLPGRAESVLYPDEDEAGGGVVVAAGLAREVARASLADQERPAFVLGDDDADDDGARRRKVEGFA